MVVWPQSAMGIHAAILVSENSAVQSIISSSE